MCFIWHDVITDRSAAKATVWRNQQIYAAFVKLQRCADPLITKKWNLHLQPAVRCGTQSMCQNLFSETAEHSNNTSTCITRLTAASAPCKHEIKKWWDPCTAPNSNPSQSYRASTAVWDHTLLPATQHRWTCPALTMAKQSGTVVELILMVGYIYLSTEYYLPLIAK